MSVKIRVKTLTSQNKGRRNARIRFVQFLYSFEYKAVGNITEEVLESHLNEARGAQGERYDRTYYHGLKESFLSRQFEIEYIITEALQKQQPVTVGVVERSILRLALTELCPPFSLPKKVAISEAVELSKIFGSRESFKFVNGVLAAIVRDILPNSSE